MPCRPRPPRTLPLSWPTGRTRRTTAGPSSTSASSCRPHASSAARRRVRCRRATRSTSAPCGCASRRVDEALAASYADGLLVLQDGAIRAERYLNGLTPSRPHLLMSVSKSLVATVAGILAGRGELDPEGPVVDVLPELAGTSWEGATVRHLLDMRAGTRFDETYANLDADVRVYEQIYLWRPRTTPGPADRRARLHGRPAQRGRARRPLRLPLDPDRHAGLGARAGERHAPAAAARARAVAAHGRGVRRRRHRRRGRQRHGRRRRLRDAARRRAVRAAVARPRRRERPPARAGGVDPRHPAGRARQPRGVRGVDATPTSSPGPSTATSSGSCSPTFPSTRGSASTASRCSSTSPRGWWSRASRRGPRRSIRRSRSWSWSSCTRWPRRWPEASPRGRRVRFRSRRPGNVAAGRAMEVSDMESQKQPRASRTAEAAPGTAQPQPTDAPVEGGKAGSEVQEQPAAPRPDAAARVGAPATPDSRGRGPDRRRHLDLGRPGLRRGVVSGRAAGARAPAVLRRALRGRGGRRDVPRAARPPSRAALGRADAAGLRVRRQAAPAALAAPDRARTRCRRGCASARRPGRTERCA